MCAVPSGLLSPLCHEPWIRASLSTPKTPPLLALPVARRYGRVKLVHENPRQFAFALYRHTAAAPPLHPPHCAPPRSRFRARNSRQSLASHRIACTLRRPLPQISVSAVKIQNLPWTAD